MRHALAAWLFVVAGCDRAPSRPPREAAVPPPDVVAPAIDAAPDAAPRAATLEPGKWWKGYGSTCIEVFDDQTIEIAVHGQTRNRARIAGRYTATELADGKVRVHLEQVSLVSKQLTRCRKGWADQPIDHVELLGRRITNGGSLTLTLAVIDGGATVELCVAECETLERTKPSGHRTAGERSGEGEW